MVCRNAGVCATKEIKYRHMQLLYLSVPALEKLLCPFEKGVWPTIRRPISKNEILLAANGGLLIRPIDCWSSTEYPRWKHVRRCAWFFENDDKNHPIVFNFHDAEWPIQDGNHRFLASCARGDKFINALCFDNLEHIDSLGILQPCQTST